MARVSEMFNAWFYTLHLVLVQSSLPVVCLLIIYSYLRPSPYWDKFYLTVPIQRI